MIFQYSPLEQFEIVSLKVCKYTMLFSLSNFFLLIIFILFIINLIFNSYNIKILGQKNIVFILFFIKFILNLIYNNLGKEGQKYFVFLFNIFLFILFANLLGMVPYSFTITSHIIITLSISFICFIGLNIIGLEKHKEHFFSLFIPNGSPKIMIPFLVIIEIISYLARLFSLAIRLFANMMSGHSLLKILANFSYILVLKFNILALIPFIIVFIIIGLEIGIAILQAYVFIILLIIYLYDIIYLH